MNRQRETVANLGIGGGPDPIQIDPCYFGYFQSQPKPQGDPIAQCFPQLALTASQGLMPGPNSLQSGYFTPITGVILDDFVGGEFHCHVKEVSERMNEEITLRQRQVKAPCCAR
jgi:hypothetical protein